GSRLVHSAVAELVFEGLECRVRNSVENIKVARLRVSVRSILRGVEREGQTTVDRLANTVVVGVRHQVDLLVVHPGVLAGQHVRAVTDRSLSEGLEVLE